MKGKSVETQVKGCGMDSDQKKAEKSGSEMLRFGLLQCKAETQEITSALIRLFKCKRVLLSSWKYASVLFVHIIPLSTCRTLFEGTNSPLCQTDLSSDCPFFTNH